MNWRVVSDGTVLKRLLKHRAVAARVVLLDFEMEELLRLKPSTSFEEMPGTRAKGKYVIYVYRTCPGAAVVMDANEGKPVGAFVWTGDGGELVSSRDDRVVELAHALEAEFRGGDRIESWLGSGGLRYLHEDEDGGCPDVEEGR